MVKLSLYLLLVFRIWNNEIVFKSVRAYSESNASRTHFLESSEIGRITRALYCLYFGRDRSAVSNVLFLIRFFDFYTVK